MKLDEHGNLADHHPSCGMQIDPVCRCTCEREVIYDMQRFIGGLNQQKLEHELASDMGGGYEENMSAARAIEGAMELISSGTLEQFRAYKALMDRWQAVGFPLPQVGYPKSWIVEVRSEGSSMWIGIEPDGSTNS
jgi:hypothetical protein